MSLLPGDTATVFVCMTDGRVLLEKVIKEFFLSESSAPCRRACVRASKQRLGMWPLPPSSPPFCALLCDAGAGALQNTFLLCHLAYVSTRCQRETRRRDQGGDICSFLCLLQFSELDFCPRRATPRAGRTPPTHRSEFRFHGHPPLWPSLFKSTSQLQEVFLSCS